MRTAVPESYHAMINSLKNYKNQVMQSCQVMKQAGDDCVANTEGDVAALKSNEKLGQCVKNINASLDTVDALIRAMQEELEAMIEKAQKREIYERSVVKCREMCMR